MMFININEKNCYYFNLFLIQIKYHFSIIILFLYFLLRIIIFKIKCKTASKYAAKISYIE